MLVAAVSLQDVFFYQDLCLFGKFIFADAAHGACPCIGQVFECCAGSDSVIGIANFGVIFVPANVANVLVHNVYSLLLLLFLHFFEEFFPDQFA